MTYTKCAYYLIITTPRPAHCGHCGLALAPPCASHGPARVLVVDQPGLILRAIIAQPCLLLRAIVAKICLLIMFIMAGSGLLLVLMDSWPAPCGHHGPPLVPAPASSWCLSLPLGQSPWRGGPPPTPWSGESPPMPWSGWPPSMPCIGRPEGLLLQHHGEVGPLLLL